MFGILIYIASFFYRFQFLLNSSKVYKVLFTLLLIDFYSFSIVWSLPDQLKVCVLLLPLIILVILFLITSFTIGGILTLLTYIMSVFCGHPYCFTKLQSLFLIWGPLKKYLNMNCKNFNSCLDLFVAINIIIFSLLKELLKKYYVLLFLYLFINNTLLIFMIYLNHILFFIILISLLGMDPKVVKFLSPFFGDCVLAWLGSYQILEYDGKKIEFVHPLDYVANRNNNPSKKFMSELDKLQKENNSLIVFLKRVFIKKKK